MKHSELVIIFVWVYEQDICMYLCIAYLIILMLHNSHIFGWHFGQTYSHCMLLSLRIYSLKNGKIWYRLRQIWLEITTHRYCSRITKDSTYHMSECMKRWMLTTGCSTATEVGRAPPGDVKPGHIMFAPLNTKRIAPLSTCMRFIILGSKDHTSLFKFWYQTMYCIKYWSHS